MGTVKYISLEGLKHYDRCVKEYINLKVNLANNISTHCPNCNALITSSKCEYCGTDFEASAIWGRGLKDQEGEIMFWIGLGIAIAGFFIGLGLENGLINFGKGKE